MIGAAPSKLRIAIIDNTCNAAYITAKLLRRNGYEADFIEEPNMHFNHQPIWEDADFAASAEEVARRPPGDRYWRDMERRLGWEAPSWVRRPRWEWRRDLVLAAGIPRALAAIMPLFLVPLGLAVSAPATPLFRALRDYDVAIVVGPSALVCYLGRRPYAVITMGWELFTLPFLTESRNFVHRARAWLQRAALASATRILAMPSTDIPYLRRLGLEHLLQPFPIPVDVDEYQEIVTGSPESVLGPELAARVAGKVVYFYPSRISFVDKGTDLLVHAFAEVVKGGVPGFLLMLDWGVDVERTRALARELGVEDSIFVLPDLLSKKRLVRTFGVVDVVMVQFLQLGYTTLDREALACGKPVVSSYDPAAPQPHPAGDPAPILPARTVADIAAAMTRLADPELRARLGAEGREWARRNHQAAALTAIAHLLEEFTSGSGAARSARTASR